MSNVPVSVAPNSRCAPTSASCPGQWTHDSRLHSPRCHAGHQETWDTTEHDILICTHQVGTHLTKKFIVEILRETGALLAGLRRGGRHRKRPSLAEVTASQPGMEAFFISQRTQAGRVFYTHANVDELPVRRLTRRPSWS